MTHSLHRKGTTYNLRNDYVVFTMSAKDFNEDGSASKMREFLRIVQKYNPVNLGDMKTGNIFNVNLEKMITDVKDTSIVHAVFTDIDTVATVLDELKKADLGISVVVSGLLEPVREICCKLEMTPAPHTVEYGLGIWGNIALLPGEEILEISTMCGHGMVSINLIEEAVTDIKEGRSTLEEASRKLAAPCVCGIFNPVRAAELLKKMTSH